MQVNHWKIIWTWNASN